MVPPDPGHSGPARPADETSQAAPTTPGKGRGQPRTTTAGQEEQASPATLPGEAEQSDSTSEEESTATVVPPPSEVASPAPTEPQSTAPTGANQAEGQETAPKADVVMGQATAPSDQPAGQATAPADVDMGSEGAAGTQRPSVPPPPTSSAGQALHLRWRARPRRLPAMGEALGPLRRLRVTPPPNSSPWTS